MNEEVTCLQLWKNWSSKIPNDPYVLEAQERMKQYSRQDWVAMAEEATKMIEHMTHKLNNSQEFSEEDFDRLCSHLGDWFFKVDETIIRNLALCSLLDKDYISFFNKYADGLNTYVYAMLKQYSYKVAL
jgi:hypothetical protein